MEKLICTACGAPLTPDTTKPFLTCEYCDTAIENKFYVEPAPEPAKEPVVVEAEPVAAEDAPQESSGSVLQTLLNVGTAIAGSALRKRSRSTIARHMPAARTRPVVHHVSHVHKPVRTAVHTSRQPGPAMGAGRSAMRPARPGRPMGAAHGGRGGLGPSGRGPGGRGPGGRGR